MIDLDKRAEMAQGYFKEGYNCCQSVLLAYKDFSDLTEKQLTSLSAPFGGGMGRLREVCGTVTAMFMVSSFVVDGHKAGDKEAKKACYNTVQLLASDFKKSNGSIICRELLTGNFAKEATSTGEVTDFVAKKPCSELVAEAAKIVGKFIAEQKNSPEA